MDWKTSEKYITRESLARDILLTLVKNYTARNPCDTDDEVQEMFVKQSFSLADKFLDRANAGDDMEDEDDEEHNAHE
jgi:hypothetical protein